MFGAANCAQSCSSEALSVLWCSLATRFCSAMAPSRSTGIGDVAGERGEHPRDLVRAAGLGLAVHRDRAPWRRASVSGSSSRSARYLRSAPEHSVSTTSLTVEPKAFLTSLTSARFSRANATAAVAGDRAVERRARRGERRGHRLAAARALDPRRAARRGSAAAAGRTWPAAWPGATQPSSDDVAVPRARRCRRFGRSPSSAGRRARGCTARRPGWRRRRRRRWRGASSSSRRSRRRRAPRGPRTPTADGCGRAGAPAMSPHTSATCVAVRPVPARSPGGRGARCRSLVVDPDRVVEVEQRVVQLAAEGGVAADPLLEVVAERGELVRRRAWWTGRGPAGRTRA